MDSVEAPALPEHLKHLKALDLRMTHTTVDTWDTVLDMLQLSNVRKAHLYKQRSGRCPRILRGRVVEIQPLENHSQACAPGVALESKADPRSEEEWKGPPVGHEAEGLSFGMASLVEDTSLDGLVAQYRANCVKRPDEGMARKVESFAGCNAWVSQVVGKVNEITKKG